MPTSSPPVGATTCAHVIAERGCLLCVLYPPLVGLTAGEALERLDPMPQTPTELYLDRLASAPEQAPRPSLLARLWSRLKQASCGHAAATAHRVPGFGPGPVFERRCGRCGATWSEYG